MKLTWIDLNSWIFHVGGQTILVDPWLVDPLEFYGLPWLFTAYHSTPVAYTPETLPPIDLILLSQGVDDHCHKPTLKQLDRAIPVIASPTAAKVVRSLGYHTVTELSHWQQLTVSDTLQITAIPGATIQPGQVENGYLLRTLATNTALYYEPHQAPIAQLVEKVGQIDVVIAPIIGQKLPLLGQVIMGSTESLQLAKAIAPRYFLPTTMGEIRASGILPLLIQPVGSINEFRDGIAGAGLPTQLLVPAPGETLELPV